MMELFSMIHVKRHTPLPALVFTVSTNDLARAHRYKTSGIIEMASVLALRFLLFISRNIRASFLQVKLSYTVEPVFKDHLC